jgi:methyl-accepting chemotaxis protein
MIKRSYFISFLFLIAIITSLFIDFPYERIIILVVLLLLIILSMIQLLEIIRVRELLIETSDILSKGNERDFSVLKDKEKNIIDQKITDLIEQLKDSVNLADKTLKEKEKLTAEVETYKAQVHTIQKTLNSNVIEVKNQILKSMSVIDGMMSDFSLLQESCNIEDKNLNNVFEIYSSFENDFDKINESINQSRKISEREINRSIFMIESISGLQNRSEIDEEQMQMIYKGIDHIQDVTDIINEFADKASILSLNASIESAHAGEAGKGFAVVAEEVGVLAESTAEHAENINKALYSVSDMIRETRNKEEQETDSYPELIEDIKAINLAFITIRDLFNTLTNMKKPDPIEIKEVKQKDKTIIASSIGSLRQIKSEMDDSIENIGQLSLLHTTPESLKKTSSRFQIHETALKPLNDESLIDIEKKI